MFNVEQCLGAMPCEQCHGTMPWSNAFGAVPCEILKVSVETRKKIEKANVCHCKLHKQIFH